MTASIDAILGNRSHGASCAHRDIALYEQHAYHIARNDFGVIARRRCGAAGGSYHSVRRPFIAVLAQRRRSETREHQRGSDRFKEGCTRGSGSLGPFFRHWITLGARRTYAQSFGG